MLTLIIERTIIFFDEIINNKIYIIIMGVLNNFQKNSHGT